MTHSLIVYNNRIRKESLDLTEIVPPILMGDRVIVLINNSVLFYNINDISNIVRYLLLNTNYYFEIN